MAKVVKPIKDPVEIVADNIDQPVTIEIDDAPPAEAEVEIVQKTKPPEPADDDAVKKALEATQRADELQRNLAEANRRADEQARIAREREQELTRERGDRADAEYNSILTAIAAEQAALEQAELSYQQAATAGDWATAAKAQRAMATASARVDRLEDNKAAFDSKRESDKTKPVEPERRPAPPADFEGQIAALPQEAKAWLRQHPEYWNDPVKNRRVQALHSYLVDHKGLPQFSREYFDEMDNQLGLKAPTTTQEPTHRRSMPVSAPVSRDIPGPSGVRTSSKITLSPEEREIARKSFSAPDMTDEQKEKLYAMNKAKLQRMRSNGQYHQTTEDRG
jgi:hypothetical protein